MPRIFDCPNCSEPTFPWWKKQMVGAAKTKKCSNCGARVSLDEKRSSYATLGAILLPFIVVFVGFRHGLVPAIGTVTVAVLIGGLYQHLFIPLTTKSLSESE
jgi:predicted RNA-binding Zn-ribbon protein involved in translation (DUF1610 family)